MIDNEKKNAILAAEQEFERRENLARALAVSGVTLVGKITSAPPAPDALRTDGKATGSAETPNSKMPAGRPAGTSIDNET